MNRKQCCPCWLESESSRWHSYEKWLQVSDDIIIKSKGSRWHNHEKWKLQMIIMKSESSRWQSWKVKVFSSVFTSHHKRSECRRGPHGSVWDSPDSILIIDYHFHPYIGLLPCHSVAHLMLPSVADPCTFRIPALGEYSKVTSSRSSLLTFYYVDLKFNKDVVWGLNTIIKYHTNIKFNSIKHIMQAHPHSKVATLTTTCDVT